MHDGLNRDPIALSEVPPFVINTLLAAEDSNYYQHEGVDFIAILSAVLDNLRGVTRGGSTITSQVAKQSFVGDEISIRRKVAEAVVAAELERRYTKDQILEYYINSIYWGSGAYGIQSAAFEYFDKTIQELTLDEAATLVVIIRSPAYYNPRKYPDRVLSVGLLSTVAGRSDEDSKKVWKIISDLEIKGVRETLKNLTSRWFTEKFISENPDLVKKRLEQVINTDKEVFINVFKIMLKQK